MRPRDVALLVSLALLWGHSFLFIKIAVAAVPPVWIVTTRMTIGGALLLGVCSILRRELPRDPESLRALAVIGIAGGAVPWVGQAWAQRQLDSGLVAVLNAAAPIATLILAVVSGQERLHRNRVLGLGLAMLGTLIVIRGEVGSGRSLAALLAAALATAGYALGAVVTRARISGRVATLPAAAVQLLMGAAVLWPTALAFSGAPSLAVSSGVVAALLTLGVAGTGIAFLMYFTLIERVGATNASMVTYLVPVVGLASGAIFRGERFGPNVYAGAGTLVFGVWLAQRPGSGASAAPESSTSLGGSVRKSL